MRTYDKALVRRMMTHPDIWPYSALDADVTPEEWEPPDAIYLYEEGCLWPLTEDGDALRIHAAVLPGYRGANAVESIRRAFRWVFDHTDYERVVARIDRRNRHACLFARWAGMRFTGRDERDNFEVTPCLL